MDNQEKDKLKESLLRTKAQLEKDLEQLPVIQDFGGDTEGNEDFAEEAHEAEQFSNNAAARAALEERLKGIKEALEKLETGGYED